MGKSNLFRKLARTVSAPVKSIGGLFGFGMQSSQPQQPSPDLPQFSQQQAAIQAQTKLAQDALTQRKMEVEAAQTKLVDASRRSSRRRIRGGMFGDATPMAANAAQPNARLG